MGVPEGLRSVLAGSRIRKGNNLLQGEAKDGPGEVVKSFTLPLRVGAL